MPKTSRFLAAVCVAASRRKLEIVATNRRTHTLAVAQTESHRLDPAAGSESDRADSSLTRHATAPILQRWRQVASDKRVVQGEQLSQRRRLGRHVTATTAFEWACDLYALLCGSWPIYQGWISLGLREGSSCVGSQPSALRVWVLDEVWSVGEDSGQGAEGFLRALPRLASPIPPADDRRRCREPRRPRRHSVGPGVPAGASSRASRKRTAASSRATPASGGVPSPGSRTLRAGAPCWSAGQRTAPLPSLWTVPGMRTAVLRSPREARPSTAVTAGPRPPTGPSVGSGSVSVETAPAHTGFHLRP